LIDQARATTPYAVTGVRLGSIVSEAQNSVPVSKTLWDTVRLNRDIIGRAQPLYSRMVSGIAVAIVRSINERALSEFDLAMRDFDAAMSTRAVSLEIGRSIATSRANYVASLPLAYSGVASQPLPSLDNVAIRMTALNQQVAAAVAAMQRAEQAHVEAADAVRRAAEQEARLREYQQQQAIQQQEQAMRQQQEQEERQRQARIEDERRQEAARRAAEEDDDDGGPSFTPAPMFGFGVMPRFQMPRVPTPVYRPSPTYQSAPSYRPSPSYQPPAVSDPGCYRPPNSITSC
jgi:hypothetical protein